MDLFRYKSTLDDKKNGLCPFCTSAVREDAWVCAGCGAYRTYFDGPKTTREDFVVWILLLSLLVGTYFFSDDLSNFLKERSVNFSLTQQRNWQAVKYVGWFLLAVIFASFLASTYFLYEAVKRGGLTGFVWRRPLLRR